MQPQAVYEYLDRLGIAYHSTCHEPAATMEDCKNISLLLGAPFCKNLFLCNRQETEFFLLLMVADKAFKTKDVSKTLGKARLSFGTADKLMEYLGCTGGSISPMGLIADREARVNLVIDAGLLENPRFCVHPCDNSQSLAIDTEDFLKVFLPSTRHYPQIIEIAYPPADATE